MLCLFAVFTYVIKINRNIAVYNDAVNALQKDTRPPAAAPAQCGPITIRLENVGSIPLQLVPSPNMNAQLPFNVEVLTEGLIMPPVDPGFNACGRFE